MTTPEQSLRNRIEFSESQIEMHKRRIAESREDLATIEALRAARVARDMRAHEEHSSEADVSSGGG